MENNSDKEMRDKLRGVEQPFDPKAWEQMEAMLEKDRKPKAFIWWWMGGVAACLMLGAGIFGYHQFATHEGTSTVLSINSEKQSTGSTQPVANNELNSPSNSNNEKNGVSALTKQPLSKVETTNNNENVNPSTTNLSTNGAEKKLNATNSKPDKSDKHLASLTTKNSAGHKTHSGKEPKQAKGKLHESRVKQQQAHYSNISAKGQPESAELSAANNGTLTSELLAAANAQPTPAADNMLLMGPEALTTAATMDDEMRREEADAVDMKKLKKKLRFNYSLGVAANITGTTFGDHSRSPLFYKTPSYMAGITQDFMFLKRIAFTTGVMFSQTSYSDVTFAYSCNIAELNIPVGLKAYVISKQKVRFYIGTGIINHIKLKEKFTPLNVDPMPSNLANYIPSALGISSNSFSGSYQSQIGRFSINQGKRYYASCYASAGVEFIVKKRLVFFTEPLFYMGLEKISSADKFKYNLGLSGGLRYQF